MTSSSSASFRPFDALLLAGVVFFWGSNWPMMKFALGHASPLWVVALRFLTGALCLFAVLIARRELRFPPRADWPIVASVGLIQMMFNGALILLALQTVPPGRSAVIAYTTPLWVVPASALLGEAVSRGKLIGSVVGLLGVVVLFNPMALDWGNRAVVIGHIELVVAALAWAVCILHIRHHAWQSSPLLLAPWQMLLAGVPLALAATLVEGPIPGDFSAAFFLSNGYIGTLATAYCFWATVSVNRRLSSTTMSNVMLLVPVIGLTASALVTGERIDAPLLIGMAVILLGIALTVRSGQSRPH